MSRLSDERKFLATSLVWFIKQSEEKMKTGTLLWDLSAAFDMLDADIFCQKIDIYNV